MLRKAILKGTAFVTALLLIIFFITPVFIIKTKHGNKLYQGLYDNTQTNYDVVLMGSSHMNGGINPNILWHEYGITSFNYATGGQPTDVTYYLLKEVLKKQEKPIVVLDLYYLGLNKNYGEEGYIRYVLDNMKLSKNKIEAMLKCTPRPHWLSYLFPLFKYHGRWKELSPEDFDPNISTKYYTKGFDAEHGIYGKDISQFAKTSETSALPKKSEEYLYKIIDLSKKEGFKLMFVNMPHDYNVTANSTNWHKEPQKMFNTVAKIAQENNIPFINYNDKFQELNFDFNNDMFNAGHLNASGAVKVTLDLGKYLKQNFNIDDRSSDEAYSQWNSDYLKYVEAEAAIQKKK